MAEDQSTPLSHWLHPGHCLLLTSLPLAYRAHSIYHQPLDQAISHVVRPGMSLQGPEHEQLRRAVGAAVASRALRVATLASTSALGLCASLAFYSTGCRTFPEALQATRRWAHGYRRQVDTLLGIRDRVDEQHPEVVLAQSMDEQEEMEYISRTYFPAEEDDSQSS